MTNEAERADAVKRLEAVYARIPKMKNCKRKCFVSCGPVFDDGAVQTIEAQRVFALHGYREPTPPPDYSCGYLTETKLCSIYSMRPTVCRLWGTLPVFQMRCPHGCEPERWLTPEEARAIVNEAAEISAAFPGTEHGMAREVRTEAAMTLGQIWRASYGLPPLPVEQ